MKFKFLNNSYESRKGQVALILILVAAIALIFYAVVLNLGRVTETKTLTQIASNTGASLLASQMASYGQKQFRETLDGENPLCSKTSLLNAIIAVIVTVIVLIVCIVANAAALLIYFAIAALVMAFASLTLQAVYIQPGISAMWDKIKAETLGVSDSFVENGIQSALGTAVSDPVQIPDLHDLDNDSIWGYEEADPLKPKDKISRYAAYYHHRLQQIPVVDTKEMEEALEGFRDFVFVEEEGDWGLYDPVEDCTRAECNPCCVPLEERKGECADLAGVDELCQGLGPYGKISSINSSNYKYVYDPSWDEIYNTALSFREKLGRDDEHRLYYRNSENINAVPQIPHVTGEEGFRAGDTTGFQRDEKIYDSLDIQQGIFPFFHKILDWGVDLNEMTLDTQPYECHWCDASGVGACPSDQPLEIPQLDLSVVNVDSAQLLFNSTPCVDGTEANGIEPDGLPRPPLAADKVTVPLGILAEENVCAQNNLDKSEEDGFWKKGSDRFCTRGDAYNEWPYHVDCPKHLGESCTITSKKGVVLSTGCSCEEAIERDANAGPQWPEDPLDDMIYGLGEFVAWADLLLQLDMLNLYLNMNLWYKEGAKWFEPGLNSLGKTKKKARNDGDCFVCNEKDGSLIVWRNEMEAMRTRLEGWRETSYAGETCEEVWCVPPEGCPNIPVGEAETFDSNGNGVRGDMGDIAACLDWNANDEVYFTGEVGKFQECLDVCSNPNNNTDILLRQNVENFCEKHTQENYGPKMYEEKNEACLNTCLDGDLTNDEAFCRTYVGNPGKFQACLDALSEEDPSNDEEFCGEGILPRSLVPRFDDIEFLPLNEEDESAFSACLSSGPTPFELEAVQNCTAMCSSLPNGPRYTDILQPFEQPLTHLEPFQYECWTTCPSTCCSQRCITFRGRTFCREVCSPCMKPCWGMCEEMREILDDAGSCDDPAFFESVAAARSKSLGSMSDLDVGGFKDGVRQSILEAKIQKVKFQHRLDFLSPRATELDNMINVFSEGLENFDLFLEGDPNDNSDSPVEKLIQARLEYFYADKDDGEVGLPGRVIYGWQDPPMDGGQEGYWHIVMVVGRIPQKCDDSCGVLSEGQWTGDPEWPNVDEYTKHWGLTRCYEMDDTDGVVKMRVVRYDQDRIGSSVSFPNSVKIWDFRFFHPKTEDRPLPTIDELKDACGPMAIASPFTGVIGLEDIDVYRGAFMLNKRPLDDDSALGTYQRCSAVAHQFLAHGVVSQTCAQYYFHEGITEGMGFKFIPCADF